MVASTLSNINICSDVNVDGNLYMNGRLDVKNTVYCTFRVSSNVSFSSGSELIPRSNELIVDWSNTDMAAILSSNINMAIDAGDIYNMSSGIVTTPTSGYYQINIQGSFSNNAHDYMNGVYFRFLNSSTPQARECANISKSSLISSSTLKYLRAGDTLTPVFYSSDPAAQLLGDAQESFVSFIMLSTVKPTGSNLAAV